MDLEEATGVDPNLEKRCATCGATLTDAELEASREAGGPFLCSTHAIEEVAAVDDVDDPGAQP